MSCARLLRGTMVLTVLAFLPAHLQAQADSFEWSQGMTAGQTLEVKGIVGEIRATLASGDRAQVIARKRGEEDDFSQVAVEVAQAGDRVVICAVYGSWNHGQNRCHPDSKGSRDRDEGHRDVDMDVEVEYEVRVPPGVEFQAAMVSGNVEAQDLRSDVSAHTVTGRISLVTTGRARAQSVSGDMEIDMGEFGNEELDFNTVSGDIRLWLPSDFSADVRFSSISGDLDSDFPMDITRDRSRWVGRKLEAIIGGGGRELSLETVSGDVELRRSGR